MKQHVLDPRDDFQQKLFRITLEQQQEVEESMSNLASEFVRELKIKKMKKKNNKMLSKQQASRNNKPLENKGNTFE